jgi:hypothetical protein
MVLFKYVLLSGLMLFWASSSLALTGARLVGMINGSEDEKLIATHYVNGVVDAMHEVNFCRPHNFLPAKLFGALEIQLAYNPFFYGQTADLLVREVLMKLTPCSKKSKIDCICLSNQFNK